MKQSEASAFQEIFPWERSPSSATPSKLFGTRGLGQRHFQHRTHERSTVPSYTAVNAGCARHIKGFEASLVR